MSFADDILTENLAPLRQKLLRHPLWTGIEDGTLEQKRLGLFALQDWWLVQQAYRLDALAIAAMPDIELQELLAQKLLAKVGASNLIALFGEAVGVPANNFADVEPLAGCMALTTYFYWMLAYSSPGEKLAAIGASEDIFIQICARVGPSLMRNYGLNAKQVEFFTIHDEIGVRINPIDALMMARYTSENERRLITRAVRLSHEFELMFYDTIMNTPV